MGISTMKNTLDYYNQNAENYYEQTVNVCFDDLYDRFLEYIPEGGRIMDAGCGSGRDAAAFIKRGYRAEGLDASSELAVLASERQGISVTVCNMEDWIADEPFDGIWCCAALLHMDDRQIDSFLSNLKYNLITGGALFISVKTGIEKGHDDKGRFMRNFTGSDLRTLAKRTATAGTELELKELWETADGTGRDVKWLNSIAVLK